MPSSPTSDIIKLSTTNFDLPSLHLLLPEIVVALKDAETHLSEFNDDVEQAPLLLDSIAVLKQLAAVLNLISLDGASDLAEAISLSLQKLYDDSDDTHDALILDISEAIMTLDRYIEFVLLKETLVPSLLIPVLNRLNAALGRTPVTQSNLHNRDHSNIAIANPEQNYQSLTASHLDVTTLSAAYRAGLNIVLNKSNGILNEDEQRKVNAMATACHIAAVKTDSLFWVAAESANHDIANIMPLTDLQKRTLIFVEQQFHDYLPAYDKRFADLVSFAQQRNHELAKQLRARFNANQLNEQQMAQLKRFLFGPNREVASILNKLIQDEINSIKDKVDAFVSLNNSTPIQKNSDEIVERLQTLSAVMSLLMLPESSQALQASAAAVKGWTAPTPEDFDTLLVSLMISENAAIEMAKSHTPGSVKLPLHNQAISLYQLDTAYETLVQQSRTSISTIEQAINDYLMDSKHDFSHVQNVPDMLRNVAGGLRFLNISDGSSMLTRLAKYLDAQFNEKAKKEVNSKMLGHIADVIMAVDYHLEGFENNHPVGKHAMTIGHHSLNSLTAA